MTLVLHEYVLSCANYFENALLLRKSTHPSSKCSLRRLERRRLSVCQSWSWEMSIPMHGRRKPLGKGSHLISFHQTMICLIHDSLSTFDNAYSKLISSLESGAQDHLVLADSLSSQVTDELKKLDRKHEEAKKKVSSAKLGIPAVWIWIGPSKYSSLKS